MLPVQPVLLSRPDELPAGATKESFAQSTVSKQERGDRIRWLDGAQAVQDGLLEWSGRLRRQYSSALTTGAVASTGS